MFWISKLCCRLQLDAGCLLLGIVSFIFSGAISGSSIYFLVSDIKHEMATTESVQHSLEHRASSENIGLSTPKDFFAHIPMVSRESIFVMSLTVGVIHMLFSILLIFGIKKNKPGLVLLYFMIGVMTWFILMISGLLLAIQLSWELSLALFILSIIYIHCLVMVHSAYDFLQSGKVFGANPHYPTSSEFNDTTLLYP